MLFSTKTPWFLHINAICICFRERSKIWLGLVKVVSINDRRSFHVTHAHGFTRVRHSGHVVFFGHNFIKLSFPITTFVLWKRVNMDSMTIIHKEVIGWLARKRQNYLICMSGPTVIGSWIRGIWQLILAEQKINLRSQSVERERKPGHFFHLAGIYSLH